MNHTVDDLLQSAWAFLAFALFFLPPGYLVASALRIDNFNRLAAPLRILWSIAISAPLAVLLSVLLGKYLPPTTSNAFIYACAAACVLLLSIQAFKGTLFRRSDWDRSTRLALLIMLGLVAYVLLATLAVQVGDRLFESVASGDWSVRVPLVKAAMQGGVPPDNPFYRVDGQSFHLRYYYYWYVLCGQLGRIFHLAPRAVLAASAAWSGIILFASLFLCFKYLFPPEPQDRSTISIRRLCLLSIPVSCILGLDILPSILGAVTRHTRIFPEMDWWRSMGDFSPSFHTNILYGPHHAAGLAFGMTGFLLLTLSVPGVHPQTRPSNPLACGLLAGVCFAATAGTSTYVSICFVLACAGFAFDRCIARDWKTVKALAACAVTALLLASSFIRETLTNAGATTLDRHGGHFLALFPRNWAMTYTFLHMRVFHHAIPILPRGFETPARIPIWIALSAIELGFFGFVLAYRVTQDWPHRATLSPRRRLQWILCLAFAFCALSLTSSDLIGVNDLGRHAGFALRFIAILWATPLVARWLWAKEVWPLLQRPWLRRAVLATVLLGLGAQLWQVVMQRAYFALVDAEYLQARIPVPRGRNLAARYLQTRQAFEALDRILPATATIQYNPRTSYMSLMTIYLNRPVAAGNETCMAAFGGDAEACKAAVPQIQALFGGSFFDQARIPFDPDGITHKAFATVCSIHRLSAIVATSSDRVWSEKQSWVWKEPVIYASSTIRFLACPQHTPAQL